MIKFTWKPVELFAFENQLVSIEYLLLGDDGKNVVESKGNVLLESIVANKPLSDIVESDLIQWLDQTTTVNSINLIKLNIEEQLTKLKIAETLAITKVDFPWLSDTFTME